MKNSFIEIDMTWYVHSEAVKFINFQVCIPRSMCQFDIAGHLGNCDQNPINDISVGDQRELSVK